MSKDPLTTYLNDHLAGSTAALELLDHIINQQRGIEREKELATIRAEVEEDRRALLEILQQAGGRKSPARKAAAWLSEKLGQAKLSLDDPGGGDFREFEALEALALGIQGKAALWRALGSASTRVPGLPTVDYAALEKRALDQFDRVDRLRLQVAPVALSFEHGNDTRRRTTR